MRHSGGVACPRLADRARDQYPELVAPAEHRGRPPSPTLLDFDPVSTRHRIDGLTPGKQREYVEALADSGVARYAAGRIGVSEQAVNRLRRRAIAPPDIFVTRMLDETALINRQRERGNFPQGQGRQA